MPSVNSIYEACLYVSNPEVSAAFYKNLFGFTEVAKGDRLIALDVCNKQILALFKAGASTYLKKGPHGASGQIHIAFSITFEEYEQWQETLNAEGIIIEDERKWEFGGASIFFRDPDNHLIELATPRLWQ